MSAVSFSFECRELNLSSERELLKDHFCRLSDKERHLRFHVARDEEDIKTYVNKIGTAKDRVFACFNLENGSLVGCAHLTFDEDEKVAEIALSVDAAFRRQKIGQNLMQKSIEEAKASAYFNIKVECLRENESMITLAMRMGFCFDDGWRSRIGQMILV